MITIGITGHRNLREEAIPEIRKEVRSLLVRYQQEESVLLDSLAAGADLLCAEEATALGYSLEVPLPFELSEYVKDFSESERMQLDRMLKAAKNVFIASPDLSAPNLSDRDRGYRGAGIYIAERCDILIALWDGIPGDLYGCGTAGIYRYREEIIKKPVIRVKVERR